MKNWRAAPSLAPPSWCQGGRPAAGTWIAGLFQQLRVLGQRRESLQQRGVPRSVRCLQRKKPWGWKDGLGRGEHQSPSEFIMGKYPWEGEVGGKITGLGGKYLFAPQLWQPISLENSALLFSSVLLSRKASGGISALFCQELLWAFFLKSEGKKRGITEWSCFLGEREAAGTEVNLQLSEGGNAYYISCKNLSCSSSHKAFLCLAENAPNLQRRKRNKYSKCWGSAEARVSYVEFIEKQNLLVKLFQFSVFLFWVFVFFKKGVSCAQRVF